MANSKHDIKSSTTRPRTLRHDIVSRIKSLYVIFIISALCIIARLAWIIFISPSVRHNAEVMNDGIYHFTDVEAHRGTIFSRDGEPLAISSLRYNVFLDFGSEGMVDAEEKAYQKNVDSLSKLLAAHFNQADAEQNNYKYIPASEYRRILLSERTREGTKKRSFQIMPRTITIDEWNMMKRTYPIFNGNMGYVFSSQAQDKRLYPSGDIARQTIGRYGTIVVNDKEVAGTGIELMYNDWLAGSNGKYKEQWIAHGFWSRVDDSENVDVVNGANVITTLDAGLQRVAHERLDSALRRYDASFGVAIAMEVKTGNVLCMVSLGATKERGTTYSERVFNHALKTRICPGSTMKLTSAMALLELADFDLNSMINTEHSKPRKSVRIGAVDVEDTHDVAGAESDGYVSLKNAFAHSSNVYFAKGIYNAFKDDPKRYTDFLASLRFNDFVGLEAYGERVGLLPMADSPDWKPGGGAGIRLPRMAYGYEVELPPIHMLALYNGVANEGRMVAPRLVDRIERDGEVLERMPVVTLVDRMCSKSTLAQLDSCLAAASLQTKRTFRGLATPFGCKTGTAQVWSTFISESDKDKVQMSNGMNFKEDKYYYGSIVCTLPQEDPQYTILVGVCKQVTPSNSVYYGIDLAGPVASAIMEYLYSTDHSLHSLVEEPEVKYSPVNIKPGETASVECITELTPECDSKEAGDKWSNVSIDESGKATLSSIDIESGVVPNVKGMGLTDALYLLERAGLTVTHTGSGRVKSQDIPAGRKATPNMKIHLILER